ncbi:MAG: DNA topoisomerase, partial [Patescibacteria group bacterium]
GDAEVGVPSFSPRQGPDLPSVHDRSSAKAVAGLETARLPASQVVRAQLISKDSVKYEKTLVYELFDGKYTTTSSAISDERQATNIISDLKAPFTVSAVDKKEVKRYPAPPFTTSTLQQEAGRRFYFSSKRTMQIAQQLYEEGLITYHRTDSVSVAEKFISEARDFIGRTYGVEYLPKTPRRFQTKSKVAQEAHEAIRPTDTNLTNLTNLPNLNRDHLRLYELIWKRAVACQAAEAIFDATTVVIKSANGYEFEAKGSLIKFEGFLKITGRDNNGDVLLPEIVAGSEVTLVSTAPTRHETIPPPRYTEATLVKTLEEKGIGRPSTYAPTISTIQERQYVTKVEKRLVPTELGNAVTDFLVQYFPEIIDIPFTSQMEDSLDDIANGDKAWVPVIRDFYGPFNVKLEQVYKEADKVKVAVVPLEEKCPKCSNPLVVRIGRYGKFIACSTFPKCDFTRQFAEKIDKQCPKCGGAIVVKKSRRGKTFYGCSNYPKCTFAAWKKEDIK